MRGFSPENDPFTPWDGNVSVLNMPVYTMGRQGFSPEHARLHYVTAGFQSRT